ncbi:MAG: N-acetylglutaminylglutamine synthetase [Gammaproteobacteria bacterium]|jgi:GNAT-family acetyltransferase (TIGR03103 family)
MAKSISRHRIEKIKSPSLKGWRPEDGRFKGKDFASNATADCGWGQLIFAHTFSSNELLAETILDENDGRRNLALYIGDPHVVLSLAPQELFLDPSHTFRLWLSKYLPGRIQPAGFTIRRLQSEEDANEINRLLKSCKMVSADPEHIWRTRKSNSIRYFVAEDESSGKILGTVMAIDHAAEFGDPENGSSLWCLAVDPQAQLPGVGRALVAHIADHFAARGREFLDLSVMHDNVGGIRLYEKLGFERVPVFCVKRRNAINRELYVGQRPDSTLNPYARIIVEEALQRGISVEVLDAEMGYFTLRSGGRRVTCRESLSELTSAIAMSRCDNKVVTQRLLRDAGVRVPDQRRAGSSEENGRFLSEHGRIVVKPARGEQGQGVSVDITTRADLDAAVSTARRVAEDVILEKFVEGDDLRVIVIGDDVVAAAVRKPASVVGTGEHTIDELIEKQSRRRAAATGNESTIPADDETVRCLERQGLGLDDVLPEGREVRVRSTANLHTGGTMHDVTNQLSEKLVSVSKQVARSLDIPVVGIDFIVESPEGEDYVLIEANERPGLANHEPRPTAQSFVDLLFPETAVKDAA